MNQKESNNIIFTKFIAKDLMNMVKTMGSKYIIKQKVKKNPNINKKLKKIIKYKSIKYDIPSIKLSGKYLEKYNNFLYNKSNYNILFQDLIDNGYYMYDFKLKQHLSQCGLNRVKQLYGTCWSDSLINSFIFSDKIKSRILELMDHYIKVNKIKNFKKYIDKINKKQTKLNIHTNKDQNKIFIYLISVLYSVYCEEGIRNKEATEHDNMVLTNFAINIRNLAMKKKVKNILKEENIAYNSYYALENILYIFNKYIDVKQIIRHDGMNFILDNMNKINNLYFTIGTEYTGIGMGYGYYIDFKNINIIINSNNIKKQFKFKEGRDIKDIDMVDFLTFTCTDVKNELRRKIPLEITCIVNNKKTLLN